MSTSSVSSASAASMASSNQGVIDEWQLLQLRVQRLLSFCPFNHAVLQLIPLQEPRTPPPTPNNSPLIRSDDSMSPLSIEAFLDHLPDPPPFQLTSTLSINKTSYPFGRALRDSNANPTTSS